MAGHEVSPILLQASPPKLADIAMEKSLDKDDYDARLKMLQDQLLQIQMAYYHQQRRAVIVFEGWDAAGKGGTIRRLAEKLDPRGLKVYPIGPPSPEEQGRHYLYRFYKNLPLPGSIAVFDRSYYGRVLVERIEGFAVDSEWQRAYQEINEFERQLMDDGVRIVKLFLHIDADEQLRRFEQRLNDPIKRWKLTEEDLRNRKRRPEYVQAIDDMFAKTSTIAAPWQVIAGNRKWYGRIASLQYIVEKLAKDVDLTPPPLDKSLIRAAERQLGIKLDED